MINNKIDSNLIHNISKKLRFTTKNGDRGRFDF